MGKKAWVTGGSRGIGRAIVLALAEEGYDVAFGYHQSKEEAQSLLALCAPYGGRYFALCGDVGSGEKATALSQEALESLGGMDVVVCNAGVAYQGLLQDMSLAQWQGVMDVNLNSVFYTLQPLLSHFIGQKSGSIITLSSMWGQVGASCEVAYSTAKAGVIGMTKALAKELGPSGVRVNCVAPGVIDTAMNGNLSEEDIICLKEETPLGRIGTVAEVAETVVFLAKENSKFLTGQVLSPNGGLVM